MKYHSEIHHRHSIRLPGFDYSKSGNFFMFNLKTYELIFQHSLSYILDKVFSKEYLYLIQNSFMFINK